jgi:hypothetical protein
LLRGAVDNILTNGKKLIRQRVSAAVLGLIPRPLGRGGSHFFFSSLKFILYM